MPRKKQKPKFLSKTDTFDYKKLGTNFQHINGIKLVKDLTEGKRESTSLTDEERMAAIVAMLYKVSKTKIAQVIGVSRNRVYDYLEFLRKGFFRVSGKEFKFENFIGDFRHFAEVMIESAIGKEDYALAWKIRCDEIKVLQDLGFIQRAPEELVIRMGGGNGNGDGEADVIEMRKKTQGKLREVFEAEQSEGPEPWEMGQIAESSTGKEEKKDVQEKEVSN